MIGLALSVVNLDAMIKLIREASDPAVAREQMLARRWPEHHPQGLAVYTQDVYRTLRSNLHRMPPPLHPLIDAMSRGDWLHAYATLQGIDRALAGMAVRRPVASRIGTAGRLLSDHFDRFSADFDEFLPDLRASCEEFLVK